MKFSEITHFIRERFSRDNLPTTVMLLMMLVGIIMLIVFIVKNPPGKKSTQPFKDKFDNKTISNFKSELALFKSLSPEEQVRYLNMTRDEKLSIYGKKLMNN